MPFDNPHPIVRTDGLADLRRLSFALKHPETWPSGFRFNYWRANTCAIGVARGIGIEPRDINIRTADYMRIFFYAWEEHWWWCFGRITARRVAQVIDQVVRQYDAKAGS